MKKRIILEKDQEIRILNSPISKIECYPQKLKFELKPNEIDPERNSFVMISTDAEEIVNYKRSLIIELINDWDVICEDWKAKKPDAASRLKEPRKRFNKDNHVEEYLVPRRLGSDISVQFCSVIDRENARIKRIRYCPNGTHKYELTLVTPYVETDENEEVVKFYSGPFRIYASRIDLILE